MYLVVEGKVTEFETSSSIFVASRLKKPRANRVNDDAVTEPNPKLLFNLIKLGIPPGP